MSTAPDGSGSEGPGIEDPGTEGPGSQDTGPEGTGGARRPRLSRRVVVLGGLIAAGALAGVTRTTWVEATAPDLSGTPQAIAVGGGDAAPAVLALALAALAAALATSLSSRWVRFLTGPVLIVAGLGAGLAALGPARTPEEAALGAEVSATATSWPLLALVPALAVVLTGVIVLVVGGSWPVGGRYRSAAVTVAADPAEDPAAAWDALTRGEDPSLEGAEGEDPGPDDADPADPR
jgi:hypothetical protein